MITATTAIGLGKGLGLIFVWIDTKLREHYNPKSKQSYLLKPLEPISPLFFDKDYIRNLKAQ